MTSLVVVEHCFSPWPFWHPPLCLCSLPARPLRILVPLSAGSRPPSSRAWCAENEREVAPPLIVDNRPGRRRLAGGMLVKSDPDGIR